MDVMYLTRHVVGHATCQSPIGSYRLLGGNMLTRGILTCGMFWSGGPRLPSFDRTAHQYAKFDKRITNWAGICWHVACWHVAYFDRPVHVYRAGTCHVEMINCEKVRLPRQICNFCVSAVSRMESRFFVSRKCFCLHLPLSFMLPRVPSVPRLKRLEPAVTRRNLPLLCSDCDLEFQMAQHPGKFLQEWAGLLSFWSDGPRDFKTKTQNKC
jgi:hypothetical protein